MLIPFYEAPIPAGFPSPAENEMADYLDLNELLVKRPVATFFLRVSGDSMVKAGIYHHDILVVDRSLEPTHGKIVIAAINGELTVKKLCIERGKVLLRAENEGYPVIEINEETDLHIWGVVTSAIHIL